MSQPAIALDYDRKPRRVSPDAVKAFVMGVVATPSMVLMGLGVFPAVLAVHLGLLALEDMRADTSYAGRGLALAGIVLGIAGLALFAVGMFLIITVGIVVGLP